MTDTARFMEAYTAELRARITAKPQDYGGQKPEDAARTVAKMTPALRNGTAHFGPAAKAAAVKLGIHPATAKDIRAWLEADARQPANLNNPALAKAESALTPEQ